MLCPKCQLDQPDGSPECAHCGIVFARWQELHAAERSVGSVHRPRPAAVTSAKPDELKGWERWQELLPSAGDRDRRGVPAGFERKNRWMTDGVKMELASIGKNIWFAGDHSFHPSSHALHYP